MSSDVWEEDRERVEKRLKDVIRVLCAFAKHDKRCDGKMLPSSEWGEPTTSTCTCGLREVFDQVDELVPD